MGNTKDRFPLECAVDGEHMGVVNLLLTNRPSLIEALISLSVKDQVDATKVRVPLRYIVKNNFPFLYLAHCLSAVGLRPSSLISTGFVVPLRDF